MTVITTCTAATILYGLSLLSFAEAGRLTIVIVDWPKLILVIMVSTGVGGGISAIVVRRIPDPSTAVADAAVRLANGEQGVRVDTGNASGAAAQLIGNFNMVASLIDLYKRERIVLSAGVAHELRTPLTILKGRLHALKDGVVDPDRGEADRLLRQVDHLLRIVGDMGSLALADAGRLALVLKEVDLADVVRAAVRDMKPLVAALNLVLDERYDVTPVHGDRFRLTQIVNNLLTNAIKHAPARSLINISVEVVDGRAVASIMDEGPGFAPADAPKLFMPFWHHANNSNGHRSSGVGLALSALMTTAHHGFITGQNRLDRTGAVFTISFPLMADG